MFHVALSLFKVCNFARVYFVLQNAILKMTSGDVKTCSAKNYSSQNKFLVTHYNLHRIHINHHKNPSKLPLGHNGINLFLQESFGGFYVKFIFFEF